LTLRLFTLVINMEAINTTWVLVFTAVSRVDLGGHNKNPTISGPTIDLC